MWWVFDFRNINQFQSFLKKSNSCWFCVFEKFKMKELLVLCVTTLILGSRPKQRHGKVWVEVQLKNHIYTLESVKG
jgi:hypothetical protein